MMVPKNLPARFIRYSENDFSSIYFIIYAIGRLNKNEKNPPKMTHIQLSGPEDLATSPGILSTPVPMITEMRNATD
jgi:hypothetical protein